MSPTSTPPEEFPYALFNNGSYVIYRTDMAERPVDPLSHFDPESGEPLPGPRLLPGLSNTGLSDAWNNGLIHQLGDVWRSNGSASFNSMHCCSVGHWEFPRTAPSYIVIGMNKGHRVAKERESVSKSADAVRAFLLEKSFDVSVLVLEMTMERF
uniref:Uncharacterized protein n=1 Tax=Mycena chlorophos TaxID=658473 RepID=A0ABQ0KVA3_MYCCL|nr:predicted protein [Mycena chlorophos]